MKIRLSGSAERDLAAGFVFYEDQTAGLGTYFLASLQADIEALKIYAGIHRKTGNLYLCPAKRFPFAIYYFITGEVVNVRAIFDSRRGSDWLARRLRDL